MPIINDNVPNPDEAATVQACYVALAVVQGEWRFDPDEGVPLYQDILVKAPDLDRIRATVRRQLLAIEPGTDLVLNDAGDLAIVNGDLVFGKVERIVEVEATARLDEQTRTVVVDFVAYTESGKAIRDSFGG